MLVIMWEMKPVTNSECQGSEQGHLSNLVFLRANADNFLEFHTKPETDIIIFIPKKKKSIFAHNMQVLSPHYQPDVSWKPP